MIIKNYILAFLTTIVVSVSFSQSINYYSADMYLDELMKHNRYMGSIAYAQNNKINYSKAVGYTDFDKQIKANNDTQYIIGSISKTYTAVMIFQAIEKNKLALNTHLDEYFPQIENSDKITIDMLLRHRSGLGNYIQDNSFYSWVKENMTRTDILQKIIDAGTLFAPDTKQEYCNSGYAILSYILEDVYKKTFADILESNIIKPLNLKRTSFGNVINAVNSNALSYIFIDNKWKYFGITTPANISMGAGGISASATDVAKFFDGLFLGELISNESLEKMKEAKKGTYGRGLKAFEVKGNKGYGHTGGIDGYSSIAIYFPDKKISYANLSNGINYNLNTIRFDLSKPALNITLTIPDFAAKYIEPVKQYEGVYFCNELPMDITIAYDGNTLTGQATNQMAFDLEYKALDNYIYHSAHISIFFNKENNSMNFYQGSMPFKMYKKGIFANKLSDDELESFEGVYSCQELPVKITVRKSNGNIILSVPNKQSLTFLHNKDNQFVFQPIDAEVVFEQKTNQMKYRLNDKKYVMKREL